MKFFFLILFIFCKKSSDSQNLFPTLLLNPNANIKAYFSYPGRFTDEKKKREVLDSILSFISNTKSSLKIYAYSFNHPEIIEALVKARNRSVKIEFLLDSKETYDLLKENRFTFKIWNSTSLHHIKIFVSDEKKIFLGTGNFSRNGLTLDYNGYIEFELEKYKEKDFSEFLVEKFSEPVLEINQMLFFNSPDDGLLIQDQILKYVKESKYKIQFLTFDHTDSILTHELRQASKRGVQVTGIYDSPVDREGAYLNDNFYGITSQIFRDGNEDKVQGSSGFFEGGILHHKTILIDEETLLTGSYNFSLNARDNNREYFLITKNFFLVSEFKKEFMRIKNSSYLEVKKNFYTEEKNSSTLSITNKEISLQKLSQPIIEFEDYFKTKLYFLNTLNQDKLYLGDYSKISTGISDSSINEFLSLNLENCYLKIFDKNSNKTFDKPKNDFCFGERIENPKILNLEFFGFNLNNQILIQAPNGINLINAEFQIWIANFGTRIGNLEIFNLSKNQYLLKIDIPENRRNYFSIFLKSKNQDFFSCAKRSSLKEKGKDFLLKKIFLEEFLQNKNLKYKDCFEY